MEEREKKRPKEGIEFASQLNGNRYPKEVKVKAPLELLEFGVHEREARVFQSGNGDLLLHTAGSYQRQLVLRLLPMRLCGATSGDLLKIGGASSSSSISNSSRV